MERDTLSVGSSPRADAAASAGHSDPVVSAARFRPEIQALRALAVALVVLYHLWPGPMPGGYVGVDVFFVISGFLITSHLLGEVRRTGTVSLTRFWARRIRRLLPASLTVLLFALLMARIWLPESLVQQSYREIAASAVYIVNWLLAADSVDYLAADNVPSLVQHYWSLSVEEQFYFVWPMLLIAALWLVGARFRSGSGVNRSRPVGFAVVAVLSLVFVGSLVWSGVQTAHAPSAAYFSTLTRAWEFAAGGLLAAVLSFWPGRARRLPEILRQRVAGVVTIVGLAAIVASALLLDDASPFPGTIALIPVVGSLLVIAGSGSGTQRSRVLSAFVSWRPVQLAGDWSYGIYLWHWPLIVVYPYVFGHQYGRLEGVAIIAATVVLAVLTKYLIEDPVRTGRFWERRRWPAYVLAVAGSLVIGGVALGQNAVVEEATAEVAADLHTRVDSGDPCLGARAMVSGANCGDRLEMDDSVDFAFANGDLDPDWCAAEPDGELRSCEYGDTATPARTIALVGDSHAAALVPAFDGYFSDIGWKVVTYLRVGCPALSVDPIQLSGREPWEEEACAEWSAQVLDELGYRTDITDVVFTNFSSRYFDTNVPDEGRLHATSIAATWEMLIGAGKSVAVIRDVPDTHGVHIPACLSESETSFAPCSFSRDGALVPDQVIEAAGLMPEVDLIDLSDYFCGPDTCYAIIGDVVVYADENHVTGTFAETLSPYLGDAVQRSTVR